MKTQLELDNRAARQLLSQERARARYSPKAEPEPLPEPEPDLAPEPLAWSE